MTRTVVWNVLKPMCSFYKVVLLIPVWEDRGGGGVSGGLPVDERPALKYIGFK